MQDDDWIKFGHAVWDKSKGSRKKHALRQYRRAWKRTYHSDAELKDGGPVDHLGDQIHFCSAVVPWSPHVEARFAPAMQLPRPLTPTAPEPTPSSPHVQPALPVPGAAFPTFGPYTDLEKTLISALEDVKYDAIYDTDYPRIKGGLLPGFLEYIESKGPKNRFRVVFPIVPQYILTRQDAHPTCDVCAVVVDQADVAKITDTEPRCMIRAEDQTDCPAGKVRYFCNSWLTLALEMLEHADQWEVILLRWRDFAHAVIQGSGPVWKDLCAARLLIGGVNFTNNFLEDSMSLYELTMNQMADFWGGICSLSETISIWPDPKDLMMAGSKLFLDSLISWTSRNAKYSYAQAVPVIPTLDIIDDIEKGTRDGVLKREFSSHGQHVFSIHTKNIAVKFEEVLDRQEVTYGWCTFFPSPCWYIQPYIPALIHLGEIRVFIVNGCIFKSIITTPDENRPLEITEPNMFTPLSKLSLTHEERKSGTAPWLASAELSPHQEEIDRSLPRFVLDMLYRLITAEEAIIDRTSGMRIFVRMDVSVFQKRGEFHYLINELTRSHQTALFLHWGRGRMDLCIQELAKSLHFFVNA